MRKYVIVSLVLAATIVLGACGGSSSNAAPPTTTTPAELFSSPTYEKAKPTPSVSAKMICEKEARRDIASSLGVTQTRITTPVWNRSRHLYSCTYVYPKGKITLSVKEMSSADETTAYFDGIQSQFGKTQQLIGLGQGAWILKNNDVVVRKDYKVLLVNVQGIPSNFAPLMSRSDVATNIAVAIMGCWSGA
jgi:hypothetical protein